MGLFRRKKHAATDDPTLDEIGADAGDELDAEAADPRLTPTEEFALLVDREWARLAGPGTWWTGAERVAIATDARRAIADESPLGILPPPVEEATRRIAVDAASVRGTDVARWELEGLDSFAYIEVAGIVSRLAAIDVASFGLDRKIPYLPEPMPGEPTRQRPEGAAITTGWAPTTGPASAPSSLTAVPPEAEAMFDIHGVLYLTIDEMFEMQIERDGLTRPQNELTAARTSTLNECIY